MQVPPGQTIRQKDGQLLTLEFIFVEDDAVSKAMEDDIRADLAALGIQVQAVPLSKEEWNKRATEGDFHLAFSETWGAPYDPHSFAASWRVPDEASFAAQQGMSIDAPGLQYPMNKTEFDALITKALVTENEGERAEMWRAILTAVHEQAIYLPLSLHSKVAVVNRRVDGFKFGEQQFDIPVRQLRIRLDPQAAQTFDSAGSDGGLSGGVIAGIVIACVVAVAAIVAIGILIAREKKGRPMFAPLISNQEKSAPI